MSWQDVFGVTDRMLRSGFFKPQAGPVRPFVPFKYDEGLRLRPSRTVTWSNLARGRLPPASQPTQQRPSAPLERVNIETPYSSTRPGSQFGPPRVKPPDTQGDLFGSVAGAVGGTVQNLNLANAIPWFMERVNEYAGELADSDVPVANVLARGVEAPTGAFLDGVEAASNVIAPIIDAFPNYVRDEQLKDRAKVYAAVVRGESPELGLGGVGNPLSALNEMFAAPFTVPGQFLQEHAAGTPLGDIGGHLAGGGPIHGNLRDLFGQGVTSQGSEADMWRRIMLNAVDPQQRLNAEQQLAILRDSIDLPESVKYAIEQGGKFESDDDFRALIAEAPEGKAWSYDPGAKGFVSNLANPLVFYIVEARAGLKVGQGVGAFGKAASLPGGGTGIVPALGRGAGQAIEYGGKALTIGANLQKWSVAAGVGLTAVTTTMDAIARYQGAEEAIAFFDRVNQSTDFSENWNVQLATGFTVNPVAAARSLKAGTLTLKHGVDIPVGKVLGNRLAKVYDNETAMLAIFRRAYRLDSDEAAGELLDTYFPNGRKDGYDVIFNAAIESVIEKLPIEERAAIAGITDGIERTTYTAERFTRQATDLLAKDPSVVAARIHTHDWEYMQMPRGFNPEVMALRARDNILARNMSYDLRQQTGTVLTYREYLPPRGASFARQWLDDAVDADGTVAVEGVGGVQDLIRQAPVFRKHWQGIITTEARVPRASVETMIGRAEAEWAHKSNQNPIRVKTGADPVLRPDSATPTRDLAEALGADIDTVKAVQDGATDGGGQSLVRRFLEQKLGMSPEKAAALAPDEAVLAAQKYVDDTTRPWVEAGSAVVNAEKAIGGVRAELVRLRAMPKGMSSTLHDRIVRLEKELAALNTLVRSASDPLVPFAESVSTQRLAGRGPIPSRIRAMDPDKMTAADAQVVRRYLNDVIQDTKPGTPKELRQRVIDYLDSTPAGEARDIHLTELASRRVAAMVKLGNLESIDAAGTTLTGDGTTPWQLFNRVEGNWRWAGGLPPMSRAMRQRLADGLKSAGQRGNAAEAQIMGDGEAWRLVRDTPEVMEQLTPAQRKMAQRVLQGARRFDPDETAATWVKETGGTTEDWVEQTIRLLDERAAILDDATEYNLRRTASIKLPKPYILAAERQADEAPTGPVYNPEWERVVHPQNVAALSKALDSPETFPTVREIIAGDDLLRYGLERLGRRMGLADNEIDDVLLGDPDYAPAIRNELVPADFEPPTPGVAEIIGPLDEAIVTNNTDALAELTEAAAAADTPAPPKKVRLSAARDAAKNAPDKRLSIRYRRRLVALGADLSASPDPAIFEAAENALGVKVLSVINHGIPGTRPATLKGTIDLLRVIENGDATRMGLGADLQAEAQRVARAILDRGASRSTQRAENVGLFKRPFFPEDEAALAAQLEDLISIGNDADPLTSMQYGLGKPPKSAVVLEWSRVPGLAEEMMSKRFEPYAERLPTAYVRQAYNWMFGKRSNAAIRAEGRARFIERAGAQGIDPTDAEAIFKTWHQVALESRPGILKLLPSGRRNYVPGDNPMYASVANIPTKAMDEVAQKLLDERWASGQLAGDGAYYTNARTVDYGSMFRESTSFVRRNLKDRMPLGDALATAYGLGAHNKAVTTMYYWFRFALDVRYWAMNYLEAQILYMGRAGLRKGEITEGRFGQTEQYFRNLDEDPMNNTGYAVGRERAAYAYKTFLKEQPDALRSMLKGIDAENPELMQKVLDDIARSDPQIQDMLTEFGATPEGYMRALDSWHGKMLRNLDEAGDAATIDDALRAELKDSPELAEVLDRIGQVNRDLWANARETFYGNPDRSRAERFLNSYLLFWPLSYQVKSTKWFAKVLFDRAGGLPTNAAGAVLVDRMAETHNRLLSTDPEYRDWFERHDTLVFAAQMFFPVSFEGTGVSLNPALRSMFFERNKAVWEIGPVYTFNQVLRPSLEEAYVDLYPTLKDAPGFDGLYRTLTGRQEPNVAS